MPGVREVSVWLGSQIGAPGDRVRLVARYTLMAPDGERVEVLLLELGSERAVLPLSRRELRHLRAEQAAAAVEQGLFQLVLDHEDNRAVLARQATERLPVSRTYLPTLFVNLVGRRTDASSDRPLAF